MATVYEILKPEAGQVQSRGKMTLAVKGKTLSLTQCFILDTLRALMEKYGKQYCYPSQMKLLELLEQYHQLKICRRTLNTRLKELVALGLIKRIRRHKKGIGGALELHSTAYYIMKGCWMSIKKLKYLFLRLESVFAVQKVAQYLSTTKDNLRVATTERWKFNPKWVTAYLQEAK